MKLNVCIGCGCDEVHACSMEHAGFTAGCWWLRFEAAAGTGVCSRCEDLAEHWDRGGRAPLPAIIAERFYRQAMFLYDDEASARAWVEAPHELLGGRSARELIEAGDLERIYAVLDQLREGAYI